MKSLRLLSLNSVAVKEIETNFRYALSDGNPCPIPTQGDWKDELILEMSFWYLNTTFVGSSGVV